MKNLIKISLLSFLLISCVPLGKETVSTTRGTNNQGAVANAPSTVSEGEGRVLKDNPIILSNNKNLDANINLATLLSPAPDLITKNQFLIGSCVDVSGDCFEVLFNQTASPLPYFLNRWAFDPNTQPNEFIQAHTFFHLNKIISKFHSDLNNAFNTSKSGLAGYNTAFPSNLFSSTKHWRIGNSLIAYPGCDLVNNARYEPSNFTICMGFDSDFRNLLFAHDPTIIYHEFGHAIVQILMNLRNNSQIGGSDLGSLFYDEALSINEGVADFFSYYINQRTHVFEWALGRFSKASRPLRESDPIHIPGLAAESAKRLSYPTYLNYNPNEPKVPVEDTHYAGMIMSHFLVALTEDLESYCSLNKTTSISSIFWLLAETMSYLGDQTTKGKDTNAVGTVNLNSTYSNQWLTKLNPINFRSFTQTFARNFVDIFSNVSTARCPAKSVYPKDRLETLIDDYGLLFFDSYNNDGNGEVGNNPSNSNKKITLSNRKKTVLLSKDLIQIDTTTTGFIFDVRADMVGVLNSLQKVGQIGSLSDQLESDLPYNNGNGKISPGELVGVSLNLKNNSNTDMAGLQVLATDWDHSRKNSAGVIKACNTFEDGWPSVIEGGINDADLANPSTVPSACNYISRTFDGPETTTTDPVMPICYMQKAGSTSTQWVNQEEFRKSIALEKNLCLSGSSNTYDCFLKAVKGADQAIFSRLAPGKNWSSTLADPETGNFLFNTNHIILFEVSPWIPPGTSFRCRFRARFTNCSNCWMNPNNGNEDFRDFEYNGATPYKIIPFDFVVID